MLIHHSSSSIEKTCNVSFNADHSHTLPEKKKCKKTKGNPQKQESVREPYIPPCSINTYVRFSIDLVHRLPLPLLHSSLAST